MTTKRLRASSNTALYLMVVLAVIIIFLLLGGASWFRGMFHGNLSVNFYSWNWTEILISLAIGILIGYLVGRRRH